MGSLASFSREVENDLEKFRNDLEESGTELEKSENCPEGQQCY